MSYNQAPFYYSRGGVAYFDGEFISGTRDIGGFSIAGSTPEIDITTLMSPRREFVPGLADGGGAGMNIVAAMNSDIYKKFEDSNDQQLTKKLDIFFGGLSDTDTRRTDGRPVNILTDLPIFVKKGTGLSGASKIRGAASNEFSLGKTNASGAAAPAASTYISCEKDLADGLGRGITKGDFVKAYTGTSVSSPTLKFYRIYDIFEESDRIIFEIKKEGSNEMPNEGGTFVDVDFHNGAALSNDVAVDKFDIIRPAARFSIPVYIQDFQHNTGSGGTIEMQVSYRITGKGQLYIGNRKTSDTVKPTKPYLTNLPTWFTPQYTITP